MNALYAIARNTFKEAIRDRILYLFLGFAVILIVGSKFISMLTIGDSAKIIKDIGLFALQLFSMLIAVMMTVLMVSREFEQRTIYTIVTRPVGRTWYLLGKFAGLLAIIGAMIGLMTLALILIVILYSLQFEPLLLLGAYMTFLEMFVISAFAVLFASITKPILGSVMTLAVFIAGHMTAALWFIAERMMNLWVNITVTFFYYLLPNLETFNFREEIVHGLEIPWPAVGWATLYALCYAGAVLIIAALQFRGKEIE